MKKSSVLAINEPGKKYSSCPALCITHVLYDLFCVQGEDSGVTQAWFHTLQLYSQSLGGWRRRRKGLANIMETRP